MKRTINFLLFCFASLSILGQSISVTGTVTDAETKEPLIGVVVQKKDKSLGTQTDFDGHYTINALQGDILVFSQVGMITQELKVTSSTIDVVLAPDLVSLDQVVVIGYGTAKKSHLSGAVSSMSAEKMDAQMYTSVSNALQGKIPGVSIGASDGNPANGPSIVIRGVNSLVNNSPLTIVDGVIGAMSMVSPNDILSVEVLKDASAAAIYGSRAAAGVIIVTTKSGKKDSPAVLELNVSTGMSMLARKVQMFNANQWSHFAHVYEIAADGYGGASRDAGGYFTEPIFQGKGTNWQDVVYRTAMNYNVGATISGGSKTGTYSTSFNYMDQEGIMRNTDNQTYNVRLKSDYSFINDRLKIGQTFILRNNRSNGSSDQNSVWSILEASPMIPVYNSDNVGGWGYSKNIKSPNPLALIADIYQKQRRNTNILLNAYGELRIIDQLKYKINLGLRKENSTSKSQTRAYFMGSWGSRTDKEMSESAGNSTRWLLENTLNYDKNFGKHSLNLLAGYSAQKDRMFNLNGSNTEIDPLLNIMPGTGTQKASSSLNEHAMISMFGRIMYSFDNRYLFTASIRRDGSSRFSSGYQFGTFPSVSLGWNIHEESFASPIKTVFDQLKLRLSYGELGNESISGYYPTQAVVNSGYYYTQGDALWYGQLPFAQPVSPQDLTWETTKTFNAGLDMSFLRSKLNVTADFFFKRTNDVLLQVQSGLSEGVGNNVYTWQNAGVIDNKGIEVNIDYIDKFGDVNFYAGINFSSMANKVKKVQVNGADVETKIIGFHANGNAPLGVTVFKKGESMTSFNLLKSDGIFQSMEEVLAHVDKNGNVLQPDARPGDMRYLDANGDGKIDGDDVQPVGKVFPDLEYGIRLGADWKGFDINMFFDGVLGRDIYNYNAFRTESGHISDVNLGYRVADSWRDDNRNTDIPRFSPTSYKLNGVAYSDRWLENGAFFRLRNVNVGYTLPRNLLQKIYLDKVRVYASFENLFIITKYKGYSPDLGSSSETPGDFSVLSYGVDHGRYPVPRTISFGIQVGF